MDRRLFRERSSGEIDDGAPLEAHHDPAIAGHLADHLRVEIPLGEVRLNVLLVAPLDDEQHPLLGLGKHQLVGGHAGFTARDLVEVETDPRPGAARHLEGRAGQPRRPHVLDPDDPVRLHELQTRLEQELLCERIADLDGRPLDLRALAELARRHRGSVNPVAARLRADVDDGIADPPGASAEDPVAPDEAEVEGVDEDVAVVGGVEGDLPSDGRAAERVPVATDAGNDAPDEIARPGIVDRSEPQRVERSDRSCAHREDVAKDPADPRRGALRRLDERRVVVALHLEGDRHPVADIDDACVLARTLENGVARRRKLAQVDAARLVRAVLGPHDGEDAELGVAQRPARDLEGPLVLPGAQPLREREGFVYVRLGFAILDLHVALLILVGS